MKAITLLLVPIFVWFCVSIDKVAGRSGDYKSEEKVLFSKIVGKRNGGDYKSTFPKANFSSIQKWMHAKESRDSNVPCGIPLIAPLEDMRKPNGDRIVGGNPARSGSWPYVVSMRFQGMHFCGGAIISDQWIVTASHCTEERTNPSDWTVHLGRYTQDGDDASLVVRNVDQIFVNPNFDSTTVSNDITLMKLSTPIRYNKRIRPICLPTLEPEAGTPCIVAGWGDTQGTGSSDILNQVTVPIISRDICNDDDHYAGGVLSSMICAGYEQGGKDACQGDSGGPLMCKFDGAWQLSGITSWGEGCATPHKPGVYTDVFNYVDWIQDTMNNN